MKNKGLTIVKQPNGYFAIYNGAEIDFVRFNLALAEVREYLQSMRLSKWRIAERLNKALLHGEERWSEAILRIRYKDVDAFNYYTRQMEKPHLAYGTFHPSIISQAREQIRRGETESGGFDDE